MRIEAENLGKRFNREWVFRKFNFTFEENQQYAIIGPNGSGKSTLLQVLWGQLPPSAGANSYYNRDGVIPIENIYQQVSVATPYMELIEEFTLEEMVAFHFKFKRTRNNISVENLITLMQLEHAKKKQILNFSSGMKQRLKLGLAFYSDTSSLFLDEPTTNLDEKSIDWYKTNLKETSSSRLTLIASNVPGEYPEGAIKIDLLNYK